MHYNSTGTQSRIPVRVKVLIDVKGLEKCLLRTHVRGLEVF